MPREGELRPGIVEYNWAGTRLGNANTCTAQGFFFLFGMFCMFLYNVSLWWYYACAIAFEMRERNIKRCVEPFLHIVPLGASLVWGVIPIIFESYNPSPITTWCTPYQTQKNNYRRTLTVTSALMIFQIAICLSLIIRKVITTQRRLGSMVLSNDDDSNNPIQHDESSNGAENEHIRSIDEPTTNDNLRDKEAESHRKPKVVIIQASAYVLSSFITLFFSFLRAIMTLTGHHKAIPMWMVRAQTILLPLQGCFNAIIFVSHKVYNYYSVFHDISICRIICLLFEGYQEPVFITRMSIVQDNREKKCISLILRSKKKVQETSFDMSGSDDLNAELFGGTSYINDLSGFSLELAEDPPKVFTLSQLRTSEVCHGIDHDDRDRMSLYSLPAKKEVSTNENGVN